MIELFLYQMVATFGVVVFRLFQNLNSIHHRWLLMLPTTLMIALSEVYVYKAIANGVLPDVPLILAMTLGGWIGCVCATKLSDVLNNRKNK